MGDPVSPPPTDSSLSNQPHKRAGTTLVDLAFYRELSHFPFTLRMADLPTVAGAARVRQSARRPQWRVLVRVGFLEAHYQCLWHAASFGDCFALAAGPFAYGLGVRFAVGGGLRRGAAAALFAATGSPGVADELGERVAEAGGVLDGQVDRELGPVDGKADGLVGLPAVQIVDQLDKRPLRHKFLRCAGISNVAEDIWPGPARGRQTHPVDLANFPRLTLGTWPTPLDDCPRLSAELGATVLVKRDDVNGLGAGGNKLRKLEFSLARALADGVDTVITFGGVQTNHGRLTAAACARLGLRCELVLTRIVPRSGFAYDRSGNVALDELFGARIHVCDTDQQAAKLAADLATDASVTLPVGGSSGLGVLGYVAAARELREQLGERKVDRVVCAVGTGGTVAGLAVGADLPITAATVSRDATTARAEIERLVAAAADELGAKPPPVDHVDVDDRALGPGYGVPTEAAWSAIRLFARTEGILLDPVYTGKAAAALVDDVRPGETVVFLHTGGLPGLYGYAPDLVVEAGLA